MKNKALHLFSIVTLSLLFSSNSFCMRQLVRGVTQSAYQAKTFPAELRVIDLNRETTEIDEGLIDVATISETSYAIRHLAGGKPVVLVVESLRPLTSLNCENAGDALRKYRDALAEERKIVSLVQKENPNIFFVDFDGCSACSGEPIIDFKFIRVLLENDYVPVFKSGAGNSFGSAQLAVCLANASLNSRVGFLLPVDDGLYRQDLELLTEISSDSDLLDLDELTIQKLEAVAALNPSNEAFFLDPDSLSGFLNGKNVGTKIVNLYLSSEE